MLENSGDEIGVPEGGYLVSSFLVKVPAQISVYIAGIKSNISMRNPFSVHPTPPWGRKRCRSSGLLFGMEELTRLNS